MQIFKIGISNSTPKTNNINTPKDAAKPNFKNIGDTVSFGINHKKVKQILPEIKKILAETQKLIGEVMDLIELEGETQTRQITKDYVATAEKLSENTLRLTYKSKAPGEDTFIIIAKNDQLNLRIINKDKTPRIREYNATQNPKFNATLAKTLKKFVNTNKILHATEETVDKGVKLIKKNETINSLNPQKYTAKENYKNADDTVAFSEKINEAKKLEPTIDEISESAKDAINQVKELMKQKNCKLMKRNGLDTNLLIAKTLPDDGFELVLTDLTKEGRNTRDTVKIIARNDKLTLIQKLPGEKARIVDMDYLINAIVNGDVIDTNLREFFLKGVK